MKVSSLFSPNLLLPSHTDYLSCRYNFSRHNRISHLCLLRSLVTLHTHLRRCFAEGERNACSVITILLPSACDAARRMHATSRRSELEMLASEKPRASYLAKYFAARRPTSQGCSLRFREAVTQSTERGSIFVRCERRGRVYAQRRVFVTTVGDGGSRCTEECCLAYVGAAV